LTGDDLYRCIKDYIRDMPWKKCQWYLAYNSLNSLYPR
jgi:hypothetical protein